MIENPYIFSPQKSFTTTLNHYLIQTQTPCFVVNHFAHIYFIAEIAKKTSYIIKKTQKNTPSLYLLSPPNAVSYFGVRWWLSFVHKSTPILSEYNIIDILDCYDHAGFAMAAIRTGQKHILFEATSPQLKNLQNRAQSTNAKIIDTKPQSFDLLDLNFKKNTLSK